MDALGPDNAFWIDGEWLSWEDIPDDDEGEVGFSSHLERLEYEAQIRWEFPNANIEAVECFRDLLELAERYNNQTGLHLNVYGDIGELYGAVKYGVDLHRTYAQGSDGRLGNDFIEIKTISPLNKTDTKKVSLKGHFSKLLLVKIDDDFRVLGKLVSRRDLPKGKQTVEITWNGLRATG